MEQEFLRCGRWWLLAALWGAETSAGSGPLTCVINWMAPLSDTNDEHLKRNQAIYPLRLDQDIKVRKSKGKNRETSLLGEENCWVQQETGSAGTITKNRSPEEIVNRVNRRRIGGHFCLWGCVECAEENSAFLLTFLILSLPALIVFLC